MSLLSNVLWAVVGVFMGAGIVLGLAGSSATIRDMILKQVFKSNGEGWALVQEGNAYSLEPLTRADDSDAWYIGDKNDASWKEDPADLMHSIYGVPLGLCLDEFRPMVDVSTASIAEGAAEKVPDGGDIRPQTYQTESGELVDLGLTMSDIKERLLVGRLNAGNREIHYVNPFVPSTDIPDFVDLRNITQLFATDEKSDTPRKAAKNAQEAERAFDSYGGLKETGKAIAYVMVGAIATYIGTTGGGGGGGGGVNIPVMIDVVGGLFF